MSTDNSFTSSNFPEFLVFFCGITYNNTSIARQMYISAD